MRKFVGKCILGFSLAGISMSACAANLMQVYEQALISDPIFQSQRQVYLAATEEYPQARALLLPNISATLDRSINKGWTRFGQQFGGAAVIARSPKGSFVSTNFNLNISEPIIDVGLWNNLSLAQYQVKAAALTYTADAQDLMERVATAYFDVLQAEDTLTFTLAEKRATARQLDQAQQRYKVGLDAITSVYDAEAQYDAIVAREISAKNDIVNARERLREITGKYYKHLAPLRGPVPLVHPTPKNVEAWVNAAERQNLTLRSARYDTMAAKANIHVQFAGHLPTVDAFATYSQNHVNTVNIATPGSIRSESAGVQLSLPIYQGGLINSQTRQAEDQYQEAAANQESVYRQVMVNTRQTYNDIIAGISKIKADRQAIISRQASVDSTEAALTVGTRTIVDLLIAQQQLFQVQLEYAVDQYSYILNTITFKRLAGTLNSSDIQKINAWLQTSSNGAKNLRGHKHAKQYMTIKHHKYLPIETYRDKWKMGESRKNYREQEEYREHGIYKEKRINRPSDNEVVNTALDRVAYEKRKEVAAQEEMKQKAEQARQEQIQEARRAKREAEQRAQRQRSVVDRYSGAKKSNPEKATQLAKQQNKANSKNTQLAKKPSKTIHKATHLAKKPNQPSDKSARLATKPSKSNDKNIHLGEKQVQPNQPYPSVATNEQNGFYTVQVLAAHDMKTLKSFTQAHQLGNDLGYRHMQEGQKKWYELFVGTYKNEASADKAAKALLKKDSSLKPWVRHIDGANQLAS